MCHANTIEPGRNLLTYLHTPAAACIALAKEEKEASPERERAADSPFGAAEPKFLCPDCVRTKRPRLDRILALLVTACDQPRLVTDTLPNWFWVVYDNVPESILLILVLPV